MAKEREKPEKPEKEETKFLSFDRAYHQPGSTLAKADLELLRVAREGDADAIQLPSDFAESLGLPEDTEFAAPKMVIQEITWVFVQDPKKLERIYRLTHEQAVLVRALRVEQNYSWRAVAETCHRAWRGDWLPASNQVIGMGICGAAARVFGEDAGLPPWN